MSPVNVEIKLRGGDDPYADLPDWNPPAKAVAPPRSAAAATAPQQSADPYAELPEWTPPEQAAPSRAVGTGEAAAQGIADVAGFGLGPTLQGLAEVSKTVHPDFHDPIVGAGKMLIDAFSSHPDPEVKASYERGRKAAAEDKRLAEEQHKYAYMAGQLGGAFATPGFGAMRAGGLGTRALAGAVGGAIGGGLYGAGTGVSAGGSAPEIAGQAVRSGAIGGTTGGLLSGALGPRIVGPVLTRGQRAAETAAGLGGSLPRGLTSDSPLIQSTTAKLRSVPLVGTRIGRQVDVTQQKAGERIGDISARMAGGPTERAISDVAARSGLQGVISGNQAAQDAGYSALRGAIDNTKRFTMPATDAALDAIMKARQGAGHVDPAQGLAQFRNVAAGADFEGAKRALVDARNAGKPNVMHPGYDAGDFRRLTAAMQKDLRGIVAGSAKTNPQEALRLFDEAETNFGRLADQNNTLQKLLDAKGEASIASLLGAAKEKGGNVALLAQLKGKMNPAEFQVVGGQLLHELGYNPTTRAFSLNQFVTGWEKVSDGAKRVLFSPTHLKDIESITEMGEHIKSSLREQNVSHTAAPLILLDALKDAAIMGASVLGGHMTGEMAGSLALGTAGLAFGHYLASPAKAAAMSAFAKAYRGLTLSRPTPARIATFNLATRNLANNLGIPLTKLIEHISQAQPPENQSNQQPTPRVINQ